MQSLGYPRDYDETTDSITKLFDLSGRVALITGGGSGLGRAVGLGYARYGADVAVVDISEERAASVAAEISATGRRAEPFVVDVTDEIAVQQLVDRVKAQFGRIDICVNSAGINVRKPALEMSPDEFKRVIGVNLTGSWLVARAAGAVMVEQGRGKVINLASIYAHVAIEGNGAYAASKGGIAQITKVLAVEWAPKNVQVNCLSPMYVRTNLTEPLQKNEDFIIGTLGRGPTPRFAEAWEMIGPALFLASDASGLVTGHSLVVDGGWTAI
ncbi:MAG: SDR family NAD(P)-dependent oxidoreductase [Dehalococcoidia bacterium]